MQPVTLYLGSLDIKSISSFSTSQLMKEATQKYQPAVYSLTKIISQQYWTTRDSSLTKSCILLLKPWTYAKTLHVHGAL